MTYHVEYMSDFENKARRTWNTDSLTELMTRALNASSDDLGLSLVQVIPRPDGDPLLVFKTQGE